MENKCEPKLPQQTVDESLMIRRKRERTNGSHGPWLAKQLLQINFKDIKNW